MVATKLTTAEEIAQLPDDDHRYALIRGELIRMPPAGRRHGWVQARLASLFLTYADDHGGEITGKSGYLLEANPDTVLAPDVAYTRPERVPPEDVAGSYPSIAPDVAAEVVSPSERPGLRRRKFKAYRVAGTQLVLFIDEQQRTVTVEHADGRSEVLRESDAFDGGDVMPGFRFAVADLFRVGRDRSSLST